MKLLFTVEWISSNIILLSRIAYKIYLSFCTIAQHQSMVSLYRLLNYNLETLDRCWEVLTYQYIFSSSDQRNMWAIWFMLSNVCKLFTCKFSSPKPHVSLEANLIKILSLIAPGCVLSCIKCDIIGSNQSFKIEF